MPTTEYIYCKPTAPEALTADQIDKSAAVEAGYMDAASWLAALAPELGLRPMTAADCDS